MTSAPHTFGELDHATWSLDCAVAGLLLVFTVGPMPLLGLGGSRPGASLVIGTGLCAATVLRRRMPLLTLAVTTLLALAHALLLAWPTPPLVCLLLVAYSVARWVPGHRARAVLVLAVLGAAIGPPRWMGLLATLPANPWTVAWLPTLVISLGCLGLVVTCYAIGRRVRESAEATRERALAEGERRSLELAEREQSARMADVSARSQVARELHDIVAHSLSVMIVQAEGGRALAKKRPEQAAEVLDTIAETGREALGEMRRIVDVLRGDSEGVEYAPAPGLPEIPDMVERSGGRVRLFVEGTAPQVSSAVGLTVYRVVQEALTNVLKHAGPDATATVTLTYSPALVVAEVADDGLGSRAATGDGRGHGLQGMRERVTSVHGQLLAQPRTGGGFLVRAIVPVPSPGTAHSSQGPRPQPSKEIR